MVQIGPGSRVEQLLRVDFSWILDGGLKSSTGRRAWRPRLIGLFHSKRLATYLDRTPAVFPALDGPEWAAQARRGVHCCQADGDI